MNIKKSFTRFAEHIGIGGKTRKKYSRKSFISSGSLIRHSKVNLK
jgi:hypothetical protein